MLGVLTELCEQTPSATPSALHWQLKEPRTGAASFVFDSRTEINNLQLISKGRQITLEPIINQASFRYQLYDLYDYISK